MGAIGGRALAAVLLALGALTSACTGDDPPPPTPTTASSDPTTPAPTTSAPPEPESPQAFIRRWAVVNTEMKNSGEVDEFLSLTKACAPCKRLVGTIRGFYEAGGFVRTDGWQIKGIRETSSVSEESPIFIVDVNSSPTTYRESASGPIKRLPGGRARYRFTLRSDRDTWFVSDYIEVPL